MGRVRKKHPAGECLPGYKARAPATETTKIQQRKCNAQAGQHLAGGRELLLGEQPLALGALVPKLSGRAKGGKGNRLAFPDAGTRDAGEGQSPRWPQPTCSLPSLESPGRYPLALANQLSDFENGHYLSESCKTSGDVQQGSSVQFHVWVHHGPGRDAELGSRESGLELPG